MSVWVNERECKRLYDHNPNLMFGCAAPYGTPLIFLVRLEPRDVVGTDDIDVDRRAHFIVTDIPNLLHVQNRKGERASHDDFKGMVPTLFAWPGESHGNEAVNNGSYLDWFIYQSKPKEVLLVDLRDDIAAAGREQDRFVKDCAADITDFKNHLQKQSGDNTKILTKDEIKTQVESPLGQKIEKFRQNDPSVSCEQRYLKNNGMK